MATVRQRKAIEKLSDFIRNTKGTKISFITLGEILKEAGYSDSVSRSPQRVTERKGWKDLMEEFFPEKEILTLHRKFLDKRESYRYKDKVITTDQPHSDAKYALDMYYKLKGSYKEENIVYIEKPFKRSFDTLPTQIACEFWYHNRYFRSYLKAKELSLPETDPATCENLDHVVINGYPNDYSFEEVLDRFMEKQL